MNPRVFESEKNFRKLDPPWFFENFNIFERIEEILRLNRELNQSIKILKEYVEKCENEEEITLSDTSDVRMAYRNIMEMAEVFRYLFPQLGNTRWFFGFTEDVAHGFWRIEDGQYLNAHSDEKEQMQLWREAQRVLKNTSSSGHQGIRSEVSDFLEHMGNQFHTSEVPDKFETEVYEARDLYCLGYYSTGLLVLGRAVERALLDLGRARKIESVRAYGRSLNWNDAKFYHRNGALAEADLPGKEGKVLSQKEYHFISILIDYRNKVAHSEYRDIPQDEAERQMMDALNLLGVLTEKEKYLESLPDSELPTITNQKVS